MSNVAMDGVVALSKARQLINSTLTGIGSSKVVDNQLIITFKDGTTSTITFPKPKDGNSITGVEIDTNKHLICTMSDSTTIDAGEIPNADLTDYQKKNDDSLNTTDKTITGAINELVKDSHTHNNKTNVLDKLSVNNKGTLLFDGNEIKGGFSSLKAGKDIEIKNDTVSSTIYLEDWKIGTDYEVGDKVKYDYKDYKCISSHTSTDIFDESKWELIKNSELHVYFITQAEYDVLVKNGVITDSTRDLYVISDNSGGSEIPTTVQWGNITGVLDNQTDLKNALDNIKNNMPTIDVNKKYVDDELAKKASLIHTHTVVNGHSVESDVPSDAVFTDTVYDDTDIKTELSTKVDTTTLVDYATKTYVGEQISNANHLKREIVTEIPKPETTDENTIYMLKIESATGNDKYREYLLIDGTMQCVGDTSVDLTDYAKTADVDKQLNKKADKTEIPTVPTNVSGFANDAGYLTEHQDISNLVVKEEGKGLSSNDYTSEEKELLASIPSKLEDQIQKIDNQFGTVSGEFIHVEDCVDGNIVELSIKGKSVQNQYTGKNLITYPFSQTTQTKYGVTFTDNKNGSINISGIQDGSTTRPYMGLGIWWNEADKKTGNIPIPANTDFTISSNCGSNTAGLRYYVYDGNGTKLADNTVYGTATKTLKFDIEVWVALCVETAANGAAYSCGCKPQLELGTTATSFEPYVGGKASPSPDYPQNITSVGDDGSLVITTCGKNILSSAYYQQSGELNGITWTVNSDGTVTANGTATGSGSSFNYIYAFGSSTRKKLVLGHTYKFSDGVENEKYSKQNIYTQLIRYNQTTNTFNWGLSTRGINSFTADDENLLSYGLRTVIDAGITVDDLVIKPYIFIDVDSDDFEQYKSSSATIPLSAPLRSIGNIKDEITYQNDKWGVLRRIGKITVDGTNGKINFVSVNKDTTGVIQCNIAGISDVVKKQIGAKLLCTKFRWSDIYPGTVSAPTSDIDVSNTVYEYASGVIAVRLPLTVTEVVDVTTANTYFSTHSFDLLYELATPIFEAFADQSISYSLVTYKGVTNISNDLFTEINVKYPLTDSAASGSKNEAKIAELESNVSKKISTDDVYESLKLGYINSGSIKDFLLGDAKVGTYSVNPAVTDMPFGKYWWRLNVEKPRQGNSDFKVTATLLGKNSAMYYMIYNSADKNFYNGWTKIAVTRVEDVNWTAVDISGASENTSTGATLNYCIKNGICYMSILNISFKTTNQAIILGASSIPKPSSDYCWSPLIGVADPSYSVLVHPNLSGGLEHHAVGLTNQVYSGLFSYPVAES